MGRRRRSHFCAHMQCAPVRAVCSMPALGIAARSERIQVRGRADGTAGMARRSGRRRRAMPAGAAALGAAGMRWSAYSPASVDGDQKFFSFF